MLVFHTWFCCELYAVFTCDNCVLTGGLPSGVDNVSILSDTSTACNNLVQWNESSSDPVCGIVWYTVTISTEEGTLIITDTTAMANYSVTGLNNNTVYRVNVTASNNAGSCNTTSELVKTSSGM